MARLAYNAPGVYVEEIPSARQPIAGVGTNTVGFIGLVPDEIYLPVPNPDYDPVLAKTLLDFERLNADAETAGNAAAERAMADLVATLELKKTLVTKLTDDVETQTKDAKAKKDDADAAETAAAQAGAPANAAANATRAKRAATAAATALQDLEEKLKTATADRDDVDSRLQAARPAGGAAAGAGAAGGRVAAAPAAAGGAGGAGAAAGAAANAPAEAEDLTYDSTAPDESLLRPLSSRPYYLVKFRVRPEEYATKLCTNFSEYAARFGDYSAFSGAPTNPDADPALWNYKPLHPGHHMLTHAVDGFFKNGGTRCFVARVKSVAAWTKVLDKFESIDDVAILAAPGLPKTNDVWEEISTYCESDAHQNVFGVLDAPGVVNDGNDNEFDISLLQYETPAPKLPRKSSHAAFYFPHIEVNDPAKRLQDSDPARGVDPRYRGRTHVGPSGHVAGIYARTDEERGVHKAPANAAVRGALEVKYYVSKAMQEGLNPQGVNCIRLMNGDVTVWGARTIGGDRNGEWKYVSVRRFAGFLEESIDQGTQWVVFEPNDTNLWSRIVLNITSFLTNVWRSGALFGLTPQEAFYVKCDAELNPPEVRDLGQVITEIGVAIVRPAEFVIFRITQSTGERQA